MSEQDGKATGWAAFYRNGKWVEEAPAASKGKTSAKSSKKRG